MKTLLRLAVLTMCITWLLALFACGKDQRVYYFNTKEIMGNKFGTPSPIIFEVMNKRR